MLSLPETLELQIVAEFEPFLVCDYAASSSLKSLDLTWTRVTSPPLLTSLTFLSLSSCVLGSSAAASRVMAHEARRCVQQQGASSAEQKAHGSSWQPHASRDDPLSHHGLVHESPDCDATARQAQSLGTEPIAHSPDHSASIDVIHSADWQASTDISDAARQAGDAASMAGGFPGHTASNRGRNSWWQVDAEIGHSLSEDQLAWRLHTSDLCGSQQAESDVAAASSTGLGASNEPIQQESALTDGGARLASHPLQPAQSTAVCKPESSSGPSASHWPGFTQLQHLSLAGCKSFPAGWDEMGRLDNTGMALARVLVRMAISAGTLQHLELQGLQLDPSPWLQGAQSLLSLNLAGETPSPIFHGSCVSFACWSDIAHHPCGIYQPS